MMLNVITLHRGGAKTILSHSAITKLRNGCRGSMSPNDYKTVLLNKYHNTGQGRGYSHGFIFERYSDQLRLEEVFNSEIGAFILTCPSLTPPF